MNNLQSQIASRNSVPDRQALRVGLEATRTSFHELLASISKEAWHCKGPSTAWSISELFTHLAHDIEFVPRMVEHARTGKNLLNMPTFISGKINYLITRFMARKETPESLAAKYDAYFEKALTTLENIKDEEWECGADFFGEGYWTIEHIFKGIPHHFEEHAAQIRANIEHKKAR